MTPDEKYITRCLELAKNGLGTTYPNPLVGSVIVENDRIIGEGWHYQAGEPHAEVNAIQSVKNRELLKNATLYVNLEPCSHHGKTPPCAHLIVSSGIKKVVIGNLDPNPKVSGNGINYLKASGCEVSYGILEKSCSDLNKRFFTFHVKKRPYIFLKWAETTDGFLAPDAQTRTKKEPVWISNAFSRQVAHKQRAEEMAILVGTNTVLADNPALTVRDWNGQNPIRLVIDRNLKIPPEFKIFDQSAKTLLFTLRNPQSTLRGNAEIILLKENVSAIPQILHELYNREIQSVVIEGGAATLKSFIAQNLWDEAHIYAAPIVFKKGINAPKVIGELTHTYKIGNNSLRIIKNHSI